MSNKPKLVIMGRGTDETVDTLLRQRVIERLKQHYNIVEVGSVPEVYNEFVLRPTFATGLLDTTLAKKPNYGKQKCWCGSRRKMSQCHPNGPKSGC